MFWRKKKPPLPAKVPKDAFNAVPHRHPEVEAREDSDTGKLFLRYPVMPANGPERWFSRKLGLKRYRRFDLDPAGRFFWDSIDGKRRLADVELAMRDRFGWDARTCREGVLQYTATLMQKQLISLDLRYRKTPPH